MSASTETAVYRCPGEAYDISPGVHLARLADGYAACGDCPHRTDPRALEVLSAPVPVKPRSLWTPRGVRGMYLNELDRQQAVLLAGGFAAWLFEKRQVLAGQSSDFGFVPAPSTPRLLLAYDERPASPDVAVGAATGLRRMGCHVLDAGLTSRPEFMCAIGHFGADAGLFVTGSGCPAGWTGMDFIGPDLRPVCEPGDLEQVRQRFEGGFNRATRSPASQETVHVGQIYESALQTIGKDLLAGALIIGCQSPRVADRVARILKNSGPAVSFVSLSPGPLERPDNLAQMTRSIVRTGADAGCLIGEDGEQLLVCDEAGRFLNAEMTLGLISQDDADQFAEGESLFVIANNTPSAVTGVRRIAGSTPDDLYAASKMGGVRFVSGTEGRFFQGSRNPPCDAIVTMLKVWKACRGHDQPLSQLVRRMLRKV